MADVPLPPITHEAEARPRLMTPEQSDAFNYYWEAGHDEMRPMVRMALREFIHTADAKPLAVVYRNYRGDVATRHVVPLEVRFGSTEHHPHQGWLLEVWDCDKKARRTFALADCDFDGATW